MTGQHAQHVASDLRCGRRIRRVGQVVAERGLDAVGAGDADHDEAVVRSEAEQVRDRGE